MNPVSEISEIKEHPINTVASKPGLLNNAVGLVGILFMVVASAAPMVAVAGYIPISIGLGAGISTPLVYLLATVILIIFSVGYVAMAKKMTSAGAFYTFVSHGLGRPMGLAAGFGSLLCYTTIEAAIIGGLGFYGADLFQSFFGLEISWVWVALFALILNNVLAFYEVTLTAKILGVLLVMEMLVILVVDLAVFFSGGAEGLTLEPLNPMNMSVAPALGVGFFLAFWSWIGYEGTAIYSEEASDPKKTVPKATYTAVIALGVFYIISAYAAVVGFGSRSTAMATENSATYLFELADLYTGSFMTTLMQFLTVTSFFACAFSFHNNASRYLFAFGREGIFPSKLAQTHNKYKSPYFASNVQTIMASFIVLAFAMAGRDPYLELATWMAALATLSILTVQTLCSMSVIGYFYKIGRNRNEWWTTFVAPAIGGITFIIVISLMISNLDFIAGSSNLFISLIPLYVFSALLLGFVYALWMKKNHPEKYRLIGRVVLEDEGDRS